LTTSASSPAADSILHHMDSHIHVAFAHRQAFNEASCSSGALCAQCFDQCVNSSYRPSQRYALRQCLRWWAITGSDHAVRGGAQPSSRRCASSLASPLKVGSSGACVDHISWVILNWKRDHLTARFKLRTDPTPTRSPRRS
jgi:hypothetical protein